MLQHTKALLKKSVSNYAFGALNKQQSLYQKSLFKYFLTNRLVFDTFGVNSYIRNEFSSENKVPEVSELRKKPLEPNQYKRQYIMRNF